MELLEYLRIQTDCIYISDLRGSKRYHSICNALYRIDAQQYSLQEWNDALTYLTDAKPEASAQAAKERLLALLSKPIGHGQK